MNTIRLRILVLGATLAFLSPGIRSEQSQKASRSTQEDRVRKLEERIDASEKAANSAAMEKDYIARSQQLYESYYQRVLNTQMLTLGVMGLFLTALFIFVAKFSRNIIEERIKAATSEATAQMRNEYARTFAKEVQKLWDSNAADIKKLKETLTAQIAEFEQVAKDKSDFQIQFVQGLAVAVDQRDGDSMVTFRNALSTYKSGKPRNLIGTKVGATTVQYIFDSLRKKHGDSYSETAREELADPLYNDLEEELALASLQLPWLTPLINERRPATPQFSAPEPASDSPRAGSPFPE
ncbi:MAG: hypothetical protein WBU20_19435, partial [Candidatus Acidiferrum sp.]